MNDYILLMHGDAPDPAAAADPLAWGSYLSTLRTSGRFDGGSSIGKGRYCRQGTPDLPAEGSPTGYLRIRAASLDAAMLFLQGNPVWEAGGTVEVRELPKD